MQNKQNWKDHIAFLEASAKEKSISKAHIAKSTGYTKSTIGRVFALEFCPKYQIVLDIAEVIGVDVELDKKM